MFAYYAAHTKAQHRVPYVFYMEHGDTLAVCVYVLKMHLCCFDTERLSTLAFWLAHSHWQCHFRIGTVLMWNISVFVYFSYFVLSVLRVHHTFGIGLMFQYVNIPYIRYDLLLCINSFRWLFFLTHLFTHNCFTFTSNLNTAIRPLGDTQTEWVNFEHQVVCSSKITYIGWHCSYLKWCNKCFSAFLLIQLFFNFSNALLLSKRSEASIWRWLNH